MDVGTFTNETHTTFDLDALDETDSVITRSAATGTHRTRWMYKDEQQQLVMLEKLRPVTTSFPRGTRPPLAAKSAAFIRYIRLLVMKSCLHLTWFN